MRCHLLPFPFKCAIYKLSLHLGQTLRPSYMVCLPLFLLSSRHTMTYYKRYKETVQSKLVSNKILNKCYFSCNTSITFLKGMGYDEFWVPIMLSCPQLFERLTLLKRTAPRTELRKGSLITTYPQSFPSPAISCVFP